MASLDTRRPAAMEQLAVLGTQIGVDEADEASMVLVRGVSRSALLVGQKVEIEQGGLVTAMPRLQVTLEDSALDLRTGEPVWLDTFEFGRTAEGSIRD